VRLQKGGCKRRAIDIAKNSKKRHKKNTSENEGMVTCLGKSEDAKKRTFFSRKAPSYAAHLDENRFRTYHGGRLKKATDEYGGETEKSHKESGGENGV